jgi:hypothetical protein
LSHNETARDHYFHPSQTESKAGRIDNGMESEEAKDAGVSKKAEWVMLGSRGSLNLVCMVAAAANEGYM